MIVAICITNAKMNNWVMKKIKRIAAMLLGVIAIAVAATSCTPEEVYAFADGYYDGYYGNY